VQVEALIEVTWVESEVELARGVVEEEQLVACGQEHVVTLDLRVKVWHNGVPGPFVIPGAEAASLSRVGPTTSQEGVSHSLSDSHVLVIAVRRGLHSCILHFSTTQKLVLLPKMGKLVSPAQVDGDPDDVIVV
jgi:hypothetical protein